MAIDKDEDRCTFSSRAWGCRCDLKKGHELLHKDSPEYSKLCNSKGDGFAPGYERGVEVSPEAVARNKVLDEVIALLPDDGPLCSCAMSCQCFAVRLAVNDLKRR